MQILYHVVILVSHGHYNVVGVAELVQCKNRMKKERKLNRP